jgi:hypothetical protein
VYVENSYLNCYDIVPINIVRLIGQSYLKFLPLNVTNLNKSGSIGKLMKAQDQHTDLQDLCNRVLESDRATRFVGICLGSSF